MSETISFNVWSILILFGAFHGYLFSFIFLFKKSKYEQLFFGLLLLVISINLTEYAFTISQLFRQFPHIIATSYPLLFLMGPFYYFNIRKLSGYEITWKSIYHYIPFLVMVIFMAPFFIKSGADKLDFYLSSIDLENPTFSPSQFAFIFMHFLHMSIYVFISWKFIDKEIKNVKDFSSNNQIETTVRLKNATYIFAGFLAFFLLMLIFMLFIKEYRVEFDYVIVLILSGLIYYIGYTTVKQPAAFISNNKLSARKYATSSLNTQGIKTLKVKLDVLMLEEKPYIEGDLKISDLAERLDISTHHLSQLINQEYGTNFFDFINQFRIENAKQMLLDSKYENEKIFAIAIDSGFNNKASFNRVFKKHTGVSPSQFKLNS